MKQWIENCYGSWRNACYLRFDSYQNTTDILEFWEELNLGYYQMRDEYLMSKPNFDSYNLSGRDPYYSYILNK